MLSPRKHSRLLVSTKLLITSKFLSTRDTGFSYVRLFSERQVEMNGLVIIRNRLFGHIYKSVRKRINSRSSDDKIKCTRHEGASGHEYVVSNRMIQASQ